MNILINATPAKKGGAKTIIENFLKNGDFSKYDSVILLSPKNTEFKNNKIIHIPVETSGLFSWFFSIFGVLYFSLKYRCRKIISFNNVNVIFPFISKSTYFHNLHIFNGQSIRFRILRFTIKYLMFRQHFVFQSKYVLNEFKRIFGTNYKLTVNWCGCDKPYHTKKTRNTNLSCIIPIVDTSSKVKNFALLAKNKNAFIKHMITVNAVAPYGPNIEGFHYMGPQSRDKLFQLYDECDFMIMPSLFETVGLPIFEFASTGKPVLVLNKPYIRGIDDTVGLTKNIITFEYENFEEKLQLLVENYDDYVINELPEEHPLVKADWSAFN